MCFRPPQVGKPKKCPSCGMMNQPTAMLCRKCKSELPEQEVPMMACPACGCMNRYDTDACDECGMSVAEMVEKGLVIPKAPASETKTGATPPGIKPPSAPKAPGSRLSDSPIPSVPGAPEA